MPLQVEVPIKPGDPSSVSGTPMVGRPTVSTLVQWCAETTHTCTLTHNINFFKNCRGGEKEETEQLSGLSLCLDVFLLQHPP